MISPDQGNVRSRWTRSLGSPIADGQVSGVVRETKARAQTPFHVKRFTSDADPDVLLSAVHVGHDGADGAGADSGGYRSWRGAGHQAAGGSSASDVDVRRGTRARGGPVDDACCATDAGLVELDSDRALHVQTLRETGLTGSTSRRSRAQSLMAVRSCGRARGAWTSTTFAPWSTLPEAPLAMRSARQDPCHRSGENAPRARSADLCQRPQEVGCSPCEKDRVPRSPAE